MPSSRSYDNTKRQERAQETAARIVAALCDLLVDERPASVSIPAVARRAEVSVRTVYSHFPTKEDLFNAIPAHAERRMRQLAEERGVSLEPEDLPEMVRSGVLTLATLAPLFEATVRAGIDDDEHARARNARHVAYFTTHLEPRTPSLSAEERARLAGLVTSLLSHPVVTRLQRSGEDIEGATELLTWTVELLVADAERSGGLGSAPARRARGKR